MSEREGKTESGKARSFIHLFPPQMATAVSTGHPEARSPEFHLGLPLEWERFRYGGYLQSWIRIETARTNSNP